MRFWQSLPVLVLMVLVSGCSVGQQKPPRRPNIVIILTDDMGYSDVGCYGGEIDTPNIDKLAAGGVRFAQFYNTSRCCPTRASLLTGLYPHQAGMGHMTNTILTLPGYRGDLSHDAPTIAERLRSAGYATAMVGKWHLTFNDLPDKPKDNWPMQRGFDRFYGTIRGAGSYYDPAMLTRGNTPISPQSDPEYRPEHFYYTDAIADQAARFITEHQAQQPAKPLFLYVAFTGAHWPLHATEPTLSKYKGKYDQGYEPIRQRRFERLKSLGLIDSNWERSPTVGKWENQQHKQWEARCMEVYAAQVDLVDQGVGRIVDALHRAGTFDDTLILYLHDNGGCAEAQGRGADRPNPPVRDLKPGDVQPDVRPRATRDGRLIRYGPEVMPGPDDTYMSYGRNWANVSDTPFKEYKHFVHEGGISTPLIAHWPRGIERKGSIEQQPGHLIDIMPTCLELAGAAAPYELPGVSLLPAFRGESLKRSAPIFFEHEGNRAVRAGRWKLVATGATTPWELYDMQTDRTEMHDLSAQEPERVEKLSQAWDRWAQTSNVLPLTPWKKPAATSTRASR